MHCSPNTVEFVITPEGTPGLIRLSNVVTDGANIHHTPGQPKTYLQVQHDDGSIEEDGAIEYEVAFWVFKYNIITMITG